MNLAIPRRIIQTDKTVNLPLLARAAVTNIRLLNPDFEYSFFDDEQVERFVSREFPEYRSAFDSFPVRIQRYDFFRYLAVYRLGGFYFDTDLLLASSLGDLLPFSCVFPFERLSWNDFLRDRYGMDWEVGNYAFGAAPGHPFLRKVIENCIRAQRDVEWTNLIMRSIPRIFHDEFFPLYTTGPGMVSRTLAEYSKSSSDVKVLFPDDVCDTAYWDCFGQYGIHLRKGGWRKRKGFLRRRLFTAWMHWEEKKLLKESRKRGPARALQFKGYQ